MTDDVDFLNDWDDPNNSGTPVNSNAPAFERDYGLGDLQRLENRAGRVMTIPIEDIVPDLRQARRTLPFEMREAWFHAPEEGMNIMRHWYQAALTEANKQGRPAFDPVDILTGQADSPDEPPPGPVEERFLKILLDAYTAIPNDGVSTPIRVWRDGDRWVLESGERRTLMHWALVTWVDAEQFREIRALKTDTFSVLNQAAENSAREDLTAIERARQLALVLFHFYPEAEQLRYYEAESDRAYYAQAAELRTPRGQSSTLLAATGLSSNRQKSRYQALLNLPERVWNLADHHGWSEGKIRELVDMAGGWENLIVDQLVHYSEIEAGNITPSEGDDGNDDGPDFNEQVTRFVKRSMSALRGVVNMKPEYQAALEPEEMQDLVALAQAILDRYGAKDDA